MQFVSSIEDNFETMILDGLDNKTKMNIKMTNKEKFTRKEELAVINSLNHHVNEVSDTSRPSLKLCSELANMLKRKMPESFSARTVVVTEYGELPLVGDRAKGGMNLPKCIGDIYYGSYMRPEIKLKKDHNQKGQKRKLYELSAERWNCYRGV